jgi:hypothetical protein
MRQLHQELQTKELYGHVEKIMDDSIHIQRVCILFQKVNSKGNISIQPSFLNHKWPWFTCHIKSYRACTKIWLKYDKIAKSYLACSIATICFVLQALKIAFTKENNGALAKNNYIELDKIMLIKWIDRALNQTLT